MKTAAAAFLLVSSLSAASAAALEAPAARSVAIPPDAVRTASFTAWTAPTAWSQSAFGSTAPAPTARAVIRAPSKPRALAAASSGSNVRVGPHLERSVRCVAQAVYHEARGEPLRGQRAVADVVVNRARSGKWGDACGVVDAPRQFSGRSRWSLPRIGDAVWDRSISIARDAVSGSSTIPARILSFRAARMGARAGLRSMVIGSHVFF